MSTKNLKKSLSSFSVTQLQNYALSLGCDALSIGFHKTAIIGGDATESICLQALKDCERIVTKEPRYPLEYSFQDQISALNVRAVRHRRFAFFIRQRIAAMTASTVAKILDIVSKSRSCFESGHKVSSAMVDGAYQATELCLETSHLALSDSQQALFRSNLLDRAKRPSANNRRIVVNSRLETLCFGEEGFVSTKSNRKGNTLHVDRWIAAVADGASVGSVLSCHLPNMAFAGTAGGLMSGILFDHFALGGTLSCAGYFFLAVAAETERKEIRSAQGDYHAKGRSLAERRRARRKLSKLRK